MIIEKGSFEKSPCSRKSCLGDVANERSISTGPAPPPFLPLELPPSLCLAMDTLVSSVSHPVQAVANAAAGA